MSRNKEFVEDRDGIDHSSDDMIYIREIVKRESSIGCSRYKHPSLGRIVVVFSYNTLESWKDFIARGLQISTSTVEWVNFFQHKPIQKELKKIMNTELCPFSSINEIEDYILGLRSLRDFISHGLVDSSAKEFDKKIERLKKASLLINPMELNLENINNILEFHENLGNALGVIYCKLHNK